MLGHDGRPLVEAKGVDPRSVANWRDALTRINEELLVWGRTYSKVYGANLSPATPDDDEPADLDPYAGREDADDIWGDVSPERVAESEVAAK